MTTATPTEPQDSDTRTRTPQMASEPATMAHGGHGWMMVACCIPMLVIAVVLVATGVASVGFIIAALMCTAMMALMMQGMDRGTGS